LIQINYSETPEKYRARSNIFCINILFISLQIRFQSVQVSRSSSLQPLLKYKLKQAFAHRPHSN